MIQLFLIFTFSLIQFVQGLNGSLSINALLSRTALRTAKHFDFMEHYKNLSLENIVAEIDGVIYTEEWKDIETHKGVYQVSNFGRVKALKRSVNYTTELNNPATRLWDERILKQYNSQDYLKVDLYNDCNRLKSFVHILVARSFVENIYNKPQVNHCKGNRKDNFFKQLEWVTNGENQKHAYDFLGRKPRGKIITGDKFYSK